MLNCFIYQLYLIIMSKIPNIQIITRQAKSGVGSVAGRLFLGIGLISGALSFYSYLQSFSAEKEV